MSTAAEIEARFGDLCDLYGVLPGVLTIGVFPTDDDPPIWINVQSTRPMVALLSAELGYHVEETEVYDGEKWIKKAP